VPWIASLCNKNSHVADINLIQLCLCQGRGDRDESGKQAGTEAHVLVLGCGEMSQKMIAPCRHRTRGNGLRLHQGRFRLDIRRISSLKGLSSIGTGCPGKWWSHHPWRYLKDL